MRMINLPQAGPRGGREAMKCEAKEKKKKSSVLLSSFATYDRIQDLLCLCTFTLETSFV